MNYGQLFLAFGAGAFFALACVAVTVGQLMPALICMVIFGIDFLLLVAWSAHTETAPAPPTTDKEQG